MDTGQDYDEAMSEGEILAMRLPGPPQPRGRLAGARSAAGSRARAPGRFDPRGTTGGGDCARRHERDPLRRAGGNVVRRAARARRGRAALLPQGDARGAQPHRNRPSLAGFVCAHGGCEAQPRKRRRRRRDPRDRRPAVRHAGKLAREVRPAGAGDYLLATVHRTTTPTIPNGWPRCWDASGARRCR